MEEEKITKVLALFDKEDIPYIQVEQVKQIVNEEEPKVKKLGDNHDNRRI